MAKKTKRKKKKKTVKAIPKDLVEAAESRTAMAANVAWSLTLMSTIAAEALGFICQAYAKFVNNIDVLRALGAIMLFVALASGVVTLILTPVVLKVSQKNHRPSLCSPHYWLACYPSSC